MNTTPLSTLALCAALISGSLSAQAFVVPSGYASKSGGSAYGLPFSYGSYLRHQQLIDKGQVPVGSITGMAFRARTSLSLQQVKEGVWQHFRIQLSTSPNTLAKASTNYAANHGKDLTEVFNERFNVYKINSGNSREFNVTTPFAKPFLYVKQGPLVVDLYPQNNGYETNTSCPQGGNGTSMDFVRNDPNMVYLQPAKNKTCTNKPPSTMTASGVSKGGYVLAFYTNHSLMPFGKGCAGTGGLYPTIRSTGGAASLGNKTFAVQVGNAPTSSKRALFLAGLSNRVDGAVKLPFNVSLTGITPAKDCWQNSSILSLASLPMSNGQGTLITPIPNLNILKGLLVYGQFAIDDPTLGSFSTSQGGVVRIK